MEKRSHTGEELLDVQERWIPEKSLGLWWLGQSSFIVLGAGCTLYIDFYLNPTPRHMVPPPLRPNQITNADLVLCAHDHTDHIDPTALPGIAEASPHAPILVPGVARDMVVGWGISASRVVVPPVDTPENYGPVTVIAIPAAHENLDYSLEHGYPYLGYIVQLNGVTLYHAGDCTMYEGLIARLKAHQPGAVLLPINGHDWKRTPQNVICNMTYREAADLAVEVGVDLAIPMHYGMFSHNTEPPGYFVDYVFDHYPSQKIKIMARSEGLVYLKTQPGPRDRDLASRMRMMCNCGQRGLPESTVFCYLEAERCGQSGCHSSDTTSRRVLGGSFVETGPFWAGRDWQPGHVCGQSREALDDSRPC